jgi:hypothetical protein
MHVMWYNEVNGIEQIYIKRIKKAPTWPKHLDRSGHDSHMSRNMILTNFTCLGGVCAIFLRLYTSTERLKRVYTSPGPLLEIDYFT